VVEAVDQVVDQARGVHAGPAKKAVVARKAKPKAKRRS
jgi:hypothetical protein